MSSGTSFKTRARVLEQLGEQLIKSETIALLELVKNAYDADATNVTLELNDIDSIQNGEIILHDNGEGMNKHIIENAWLEIGTSYKDELNKSVNENVTNKYKRNRLGEKGIGRFGVHKLGKFIELITRRKDEKEYVIAIDWEKLDGYKYLENFPVSVKEREPQIFKGKKSGTRIIIRKLRTNWSRGMLRESYRGINSLNSPFNYKNDFKVVFQTNKEEWLEGLLRIDDVEEYALFKFSATLDGDEITKFRYEFIPWDTMKGIKSRVIDENDALFHKVKKVIFDDKKNQEQINLNDHKIGKITFQGFIFDRDARILELGVTDKKGLKEYLNMNGGIRIYRDNIRVYDYGEPGNDWLNLGGRRVNVPAKRISNNIVIGAINLDRKASSDLVEQANREGFIINEAYDCFLKAILYVVEKVETYRKIDKDILRSHYGPNVASEPVITNLSMLSSMIEKHIKKEPVKKQIRQFINRIEKEYEQTVNVLIKSAGAGLNLIVVIHEMEKLNKSLMGILKSNKKYSDQAFKIAERFANLIEGYSILVKKSDKKPKSLVKAIKHALFTTEIRLESHQIFIDNFFEKRDDKIIEYSSDLLVGTLMNIIDNSIWWLNYYNPENKKIFIDISNDITGYISLIIADNGKGFSLPTNEIIRPFVTGKPDGMGIGLHIAAEVMKTHKGKVYFPDKNEIYLPDDYKNGAVVALAFKIKN